MVETVDKLFWQRKVTGLKVKQVMQYHCFKEKTKSLCGRANWGEEVPQTKAGVRFEHLHQKEVPDYVCNVCLSKLGIHRRKTGKYSSVKSK